MSGFEVSNASEVQEQVDLLAPLAFGASPKIEVQDIPPPLVKVPTTQCFFFFKNLAIGQSSDS